MQNTANRLVTFNSEPDLAGSRASILHLLEEALLPFRAHLIIAIEELQAGDDDANQTDDGRRTSNCKTRMDTENELL